MQYSVWKIVIMVTLAMSLSINSWAQEEAAGAAEAVEAAEVTPDMAIGEGKQVSMEYTLTLEDGTEAGNNVGQAPLIYTHGKGQIVPGLEKELVGMKAGDTKKVEVTPKDGYGDVDPKRTQQVPIDKIPEQARKVGAQLRGQGPGGQLMFAKVTELDDKMATIDMNHPLAGQKLLFDVKILKVEEAGNALEMPAPAAAPEAATPGQ